MNCTSEKRIEIEDNHLTKKVNNESFGTIEKIIVVLKGDPSYTSGDQKWKGAADILNNKVIVTNKIPINTKKWINENSFFKSKDNNNSILFKFKVPKPPYIKEQPKRKNPEIKEPETKYFNPASVENEEFLRKLANI